MQAAIVYSEVMHFWHRDLDGIHAFYINGLFRALFMSLTVIYVPIFLFMQGRVLWGSVENGLLLVVLYFALQRLLVILTLFPLSKLIERMGFRRSITWSALCLMGFTICLVLAPQNILWIWISSGFMALNIPLYWLSRDSAISQDVASNKMGDRMGHIVVLENIAGLMGPFAGGAIVVIFGYPTLFVVSLLVLGLSIVPLWWMSPHTHKNGVSLKGFWYFATNKRYVHQSVAAFGSALNDYGNSVIWPLVLFLQGIRDEKMGAVYSLAGGVTIVVQYLSGRWFDKLRSRRDYTDEGVYGLASVGLSLTWIARLFVRGFAYIVPLDLGRQLFGAIHTNFFSDYLHLGGRRMGSIAYWVYIEIMYSLGTVFLFGVMALGIYTGFWKELVFATIALWSLATIVIARESNMR